MNSKSARTADRFRAAVLAGKFTDANDLLDAMRSEVEAAWRATGSRNERERIASETTRLLKWARVSILAARTHTQSKLAALNRESAYTPTPRPSRSRLNLEI